MIPTLYSIAHPDIRLNWSPSSLSRYDADPFSYCISRFRTFYRPERRQQLWGKAFHHFAQQVEVARLKPIQYSTEPLLLMLLREALTVLKAGNFYTTPCTIDEKAKRTVAMLIQACTAYFDTFYLDGGLLLLGQKAVEVEFSYPLPFKAPCGQSYILNGYLDMVRGSTYEVRNSTPTIIYPTEIKTRGKGDAPRYVQFYLRPSIQVRAYDFVSAIYAKTLGLQYYGINVIVLELLNKSCRFHIDILHFEDEERAWFLEWLHKTIKRHEWEALNGWLGADAMIASPYCRMSGVSFLQSDDGDPGLGTLIDMPASVRANYFNLKGNGNGVVSNPLIPSA